MKNDRIKGLSIALGFAGVAIAGLSFDAQAQGRGNERKEQAQQQRQERREERQQQKAERREQRQASQQQQPVQRRTPPAPMPAHPQQRQQD